MLIKLNLQRFASDYVTWATANGHIEASLKFKHLYANDKIGTGTYKFRHWSQTELLPRLLTPQNVSVESNVASWDAVENAESYDIYADGALIDNTTGEGLV